MSSQRYICGHCGHTFDEEDLDTVYQYDGEGVMGGYHPVDAVCPDCGSDVYEAEECCCCGQDFDKENDMIEVDGAWYCKDCAGKIYDAYFDAWGKDEERSGGNE